MHVVRDQAVAHHRHAFHLHGLAYQIEMNHPLRFARLLELPPSAALRLRVRDLRDDHPRQPGHGPKPD